MVKAGSNLDVTRRAAKLTAVAFLLFLVLNLLAEGMFPKDRVSFSWSTITGDMAGKFGMWIGVFCFSWVCFRVYLNFACPDKVSTQKSSE